MRLERWASKDRKYVIVFDSITRTTQCLRYGQPWRDITSDKLMKQLLDEVMGMAEDKTS